MKKILGLDLGTNSIGWAVVEAEDNGTPKDILAMGSRIVPLSSDDANEFSTGNAISKNQKRTQNRTTRKGYDRYQARRLSLTQELRKLGMLPDECLIKLPVLELWKMRANAATVGNQLTLPEIGRVLYHLNQKRGYKHAKSDENADNKQKEYVANVNARYAKIKDLGLTIGQYFAEQLENTKTTAEDGKIFYTYRTKEQVFPRQAYEAEFDQIMQCQQRFYPEILTNDVIYKLRNEIIYYQRKLKSCKHLVSLCEFEKRAYTNKEGKIVYDGPKVAPRTSPLFQVCKIWESVNALTLKNKKGDELFITLEQRQKLFNHLNSNEKLTLTDMYKILDISKSDGWWGGKAIGKGLQGNTTKMQLEKALDGFQNADKLLQFNLKFISTDKVDEETGEIIQIVSPDFQDEPLYKLWHTIYSLQDKTELKNALKKNFEIEDEEIVQNLFQLDFVKPGFGNKSSKFMRKILPYLQSGLKYSEACEYVGIQHSDSLTKKENEERELCDKLKAIQKNELRQPVVEKILNQMINIVNAIIDKYGKPDEVRVELARELKQSKDERAEADKNNRTRQRDNERISKRIEEDCHLQASKNRIQKYRMWEESGHKCFYCGQTVNVCEFLQGLDYEKEHIVPKSLLFDNSFNNQVCSCRKCNAAKSNQTAFDFMKSKSKEEFENYLSRIETYYKDKKISKTKRERLLTPFNKIPTDFIERQLRQSQYIARKSQEILQTVCRNVWATSGAVTDFLRHSWGYDDILHDLSFEKYKNVGLTEFQTFTHKGQTYQKERIKNWSKRIDHRHHAIDALVIAQTRQGFIQKLNNLNTERDEMFADVEKQSEEWKEKHSLLEKWIKIQPHIALQVAREKVDEILISFKAGKKSASVGKRYVYKNNKRELKQKNIIIPRGALHEQTVYGQIQQSKADGTFEPVIVVKYDLGVGQGYLFSGNETIKTKKSGEVNDGIKKVLDSIVDKGIRQIVENRLNQGFEEGKTYKDDVKKALENLKNLDTNPLYADKNHKIPIRSIRCYTGLTAVVPIKYNEKNEAIGFVKPGNNHHIAIYENAKGELMEQVVTLWHAVERKKYNIPVIIEHSNDVWDNIIEWKKEEDLLPQTFLENLPERDWNLKFSLQQNEMFVLGLEEEALQDAISAQDYATLSKHLYRVQSIAEGNYRFRLHIETSVDDKYDGKRDEMLSKQIGKLKIVQSFDALKKLNPHKVKITLLGEIVSIGEY